MKLTPVLLMESVMDGLQFWVERMGWSKTVEVPEGDGLAFLKRLEGYEIALREHVTFYGMREVGVFTPGGHVAVFARQE